MKAAGWADCSVCGLANRAYPPRGWKPGEQLVVWRHHIVQGERCPGSYKPGTNTTLDTEREQAST
jgi:hypothetical protein